MTLFGSGIDFYGGPRESAHKQFNKIPAQKTQQRVSEFAQQTALQYYDMLVSGNAVHDCQSNLIFNINQEILKQIWTPQNQQETFSLKCPESMISKLVLI